MASHFLCRRSGLSTVVLHQQDQPEHPQIPSVNSITRGYAWLDQDFFQSVNTRGNIFFDLIHHIRNSPWLHRDDPIAPSYVRTRVVSLLIDMEHSKLQLDCTAACTVRCIACRLNNLLPHLSCEIKVFKLSSLLVRLRIASLSHAALPWGPALEAPGRYRYRAGLFRVCARVDQECVQSVNTYIIFQAGFSL